MRICECLRAQDIRGMSALRRPEWNVDVRVSKKRNNPLVIWCQKELLTPTSLYNEKAILKQSYFPDLNKWSERMIMVFMRMGILMTIFIYMRMSFNIISFFHPNLFFKTLTSTFHSGRRKADLPGCLAPSNIRKSALRATLLMFGGS